MAPELEPTPVAGGASCMNGGKDVEDALFSPSFWW